MTNIDLTSVERKSYRSMFDDGLLDLFIGISLLFLGLMWLTEYGAFGGLMPALLIPIWPIARKTFVEPRSGYARLAEPRRNKLRRGIAGSIAFGTLTLLLAIAAYVGLTSDDSATEAIFDSIGSALPALLLALMATVAARMFELPRFFGYAGVLLTMGLLGLLLDLEPAWPLLASAVFVTATAGMLMARFVRNTEVIAHPDSL